MDDTSPATSGKLRSRKFRNTQKAWKRLRAQFKPIEDQGDMKYQKVLGSGGFGLVQKWRTNLRGRRNTVAIKTIIQPDQDNCIRSLKREIYWMRRFQGCEHLVQLADLPESAMTLLSPQINNDDCDGVPIVVMEDLGSGSLALLLSRMADMRALNRGIPEDHMSIKSIEYIPNRALWIIRACIGMAYPPEDPDSRKGKIIRETMKDVPKGTQPSRIIHSDIDIYNSFIGYPSSHKPDDNEHVWHPIVKIADYGCMIRWDYHWSDDTKKKSLWGKPAYKAPEQFDPHGSFGTHTNVYQIGNIMHDLITLRKYSYNQRVVAKRKLSGNGGLEFWTFGCRLLEGSDYSIDKDWKNVDIELRELVAGCMAEKPIFRPALEPLEELCALRIREMDKAVKDAKQGRNPSTPVYVPGIPSDDKTFRRRVPMGQVEPDHILEKFYIEYFIEPWGESDKYAAHWAGRTPSPTRTETTHLLDSPGLPRPAPPQHGSPQPGPPPPTPPRPLPPRPLPRPPKSKTRSKGSHS
ncbi:kinase-like protein [Ustulina deusta]|nr:kinase-like protein [Ustulina deusta]